LKGRQHCDEKYVKVNGKDCYDLNCTDNITKYQTAHLFVEKRTKKKCEQFFKQVKDSSYDQILACYKKEKHKPMKKRKLFTFVFDGFKNYKSSWSKLFYRVTKCTAGVSIACKKYGLKHNNNASERYNGKLKDVLNGMRGSFKSFEYAEVFMNLQNIMNNFVNPHQQLQGKTPAEAAEIILPLGRNKILGLIKYLINHSDD